MDEELTPPVQARPVGTPRIGWKDVACLGPIIANSVYYYVGLPLQAVLIGTHPLLLSALRGSIAAMVATGGFARVGRVPLLLALVAPVPISMVTDPFYYWAGHRYGRRVLEYLERNDPRWRRRVARGERFFQRFGVWAIVLAPFLPVPSLLFYLAAGEARMPFLLFIAADLLGTLLFIGAVVAAGWAVGQAAVSAAETISKYSLWSVLGIIVLAVAWSLWTNRGAASRTRQ